MKKYRIIIAGSRTITNKQIIFETMDLFLYQKQIDEIVIISGCANGVDTIGSEYARERGIELLEYPALWQVGGYFDRGAGIKRNTKMAEVGTHLFLFWDGSSSGSKNMLQQAKINNLIIKEIIC